MRTVQLTLDEDLVRSVDRLAKENSSTRSAFTRDALREAIRVAQMRKMEEKHRLGYARKPVEKEEFAGWESEQNWGDA